MNVSASVVTYNNQDDIALVLDSLKNSDLVRNNIIVVDNNSSDNTVNIINRLYNDVHLIKSPENLGFGAAHNLALKRIDSKYHIFVNPDISFDPVQLKKMVIYMEENPDVVLLTPKVLNFDGSEQYLPKKLPSIRYLISSKYENNIDIFHKWRSEYTLREENIVKPIEIDFSTGCFMVCRTDILLKVGGFDERYFLYFEDADLTRKMKKYGRVIYNPSVYVNHKWKRENLKNKKGAKIAINSMLKYFCKWGLRI